MSDPNPLHLQVFPSETAPVKVSIVIINWNGQNHIRQCLQSLDEQTMQDFELLFVDNGSIDGSIDSLREFNFKRLRLIQNSENYGFARAVNQAIRSSMGQYIALLNNDVFLAPDWLEEMQKGIEMDPRVGMCASKILFAQNPMLIDKVGHVFCPDGQIYGRGHREEDQGQYDQLEEVLWPDGAAALYSSKLFQDVGLFDEKFVSYCEDADLGLRARLMNWKCLYQPKARAFHYRSATYGEYDARKIFLIERNRIWLSIKLLPKRQLFVIPVYTAFRLLYSFLALISRRGDVGRAAGLGDLRSIIYAILRAQASAAWGIVKILRDRQQIRRVQEMPSSEVMRMLRAHSITIKQLTFGNKLTRALNEEQIPEGSAGDLN